MVETISHWLQGRDDLASDSVRPKRSLLQALIEQAEAGLDLGSASVFLQNALAYTKHQEGRLREGTLSLKGVMSHEAAFMALTLAEKQNEALDAFARFLTKRTSRFLADMDFEASVREKMRQGVSPEIAIEENLRILREKLDSLSEPFVYVAIGGPPDSVAQLREAAGLSFDEYAGAFAQVFPTGPAMPITSEEIFRAAANNLVLEAMAAQQLESQPVEYARPSGNDDDALIADDEFWTLAKEVALTELRARLDSPEDHTAYIRARINPVLSHVQP